MGDPTDEVMARPAVNAHRQRQLMEALSRGPVTTRELNFPLFQHVGDDKNA